MKLVHVSLPSPNGIVDSNVPRVVLALPVSEARMQQFPGVFPPSADCAIKMVGKTVRSVRVNSICLLNL